MQQNFTRRFIICLLPLLIAGYLTVKAFFKEEGGFRLGTDLAGGTILVYELDKDLTDELNKTQGVTDVSASQSSAEATQNMSQLVTAIKRRIDPGNQREVTVRAVGQSRIEIILPTGGKTSQGKSAFTQAQIEEAKELIRRVGALEFRIIANKDDDAAVISTIETQFTDPEFKKRLEQRGVLGLPPEAPTGEYTETITNERAGYSWVELDKEERVSLGISNKQFISFDASKKDAAADPEKKDAEKKDEPATTSASPRWTQLKTIREQAGVYYDPDARMLLYSRECKSERLTKEERDFKKIEYFVLTRTSPTDSLTVAGSITITARSEVSKNRPAVGFTFNSVGAEKFRAITTKNQPSGSGGKIVRKLAIILDGKVKSAPNLNAVIGASGVIEGESYTNADVNSLVKILRSGALSAVLKPQPVSEDTISPTLGSDTIKKGTMAVFGSFIAILAFMLYYYEFAGIVASVALFANLLLTVGFMVMMDASFTLPGLAGIVLMLGMAVDANVLIYERIREEGERGANLITSIRNGYDRAFPTIIDTHLSSIFTAVVLYAVGNDQLKGFGVSLTVGLIISLFTSLYMTRLMFDFWMVKTRPSRLRMHKLFSRPNINFMSIRQLMFTITLVLSVAGVAIFLMRGLDGLNIDFRGGTAFGGELRKEVEIGKLRELLSEAKQKEQLNVESVTEKKDPTGIFTNLFEIKFKDGQSSLVSLANAPKGTNDAERSENVKVRVSQLPDWSVEQIFRNSARAEGSVAAPGSRFFTVRTTEQEKELVQLMISRLLEENKDDSLLVQSTFVVSDGADAKTKTLTFTELGTQTPAKLSIPYVKNLIEREVRTLGVEFSRPDIDPIDIKATGEKGQDKFDVMSVTFLDASITKPDLIAKVLEQAKRTLQIFPEPERLETFDPTLAGDMQDRAIVAILASWIAILLYLWFRFGNWTFGAAAVACLIHDLCFTLGAIGLCYYVHDTTIGQMLGLVDFKIDLPAVAALLTLVGYSVNDTIVVFDRIREVRGKSPKLTTQMINDSINQTLSRTVLASMTVFLVVFVLYCFGGEGVHLFAFVMVIGVIVGTYSSIYIASPLLLILGEGEPDATITESKPAIENTKKG
jgi:SecD/SecF fusion protein